MKHPIIHIIQFTLIIFACINATISEASEKEKRILIISSYNPETSSTSTLIDDFSNYIDNHSKGFNIIIESMNCKSLSEATAWPGRIHNIIKKHLNDDIAPSMILLLGQEAWTAYLSLNPADVMPNTPAMCAMASRNIVRIPADTCHIDSWIPNSIDYTFLKSRYNIVGGILYEYNIDKNIDLIRQLFPNTKNVALLTDNSYGGLTMMAYINDYMLKHKEYKFIRLDGRQKNIYSMSENIDNLPPKTVLLLGTWRVDKTESFYVKNSSRILMEANKNLPVISLSSLGMKYWSIGGYIPQYDPQGELLAQKVISYFRTPSEYGFKDDLFSLVPNHYTFNCDLLDPIKEQVNFIVPEDADFIAPTDSFYQTYKIAINIIIAVFIMLLIIMAIIYWFLSKTRKLNAQMKNYQRELLIQKEKAEENNHKKTAFLANMSHEIRTPLNAIVGFADVLTSDTSLSDEDRKQINNIISQNSQMLLTLINEILDMSRLESGKMKYQTEQCDVVKLCKDILTTCKAAASKSEINYIFDCDIERCEALIDIQHIKEVLINLISNSNKFTTEGSITLTFRKLESILYFAVTDTGIGISTEKRDKIFERYEKVNEDSQGSGIGLSLCKNIVEYFKGRIWVDPQYTNGARLCFTIPYTTN